MLTLISPLPPKDPYYLVKFSICLISVSFPLYPWICENFLKVPC